MGAPPLINFIATVRIRLVYLFLCPSATVVGTPDDKSIVSPHHEVMVDALAAPSAA